MDNWTIELCFALRATCVPAIVTRLKFQRGLNAMIDKMVMKGRPDLVTTRPDRQTQLSCLMDSARPLVHIHHRRVIVCAICTDNILLDDDFSAQMTEFDEFVMMPLDLNMDVVASPGYSVPTDVVAFGAVMFALWWRFFIAHPNPK